MIQLCQCPGFTGEPFRKCRIIADPGRKNLQRNDAIELFLSGFVDRTHAALADEFQDFELRKMLRNFLGGGRGFPF
jgi:hypothetical protein